MKLRHSQFMNRFSPRLLMFSTLTLLGTATAQSFRGLEAGVTGGWASGFSGEISLHKPDFFGSIGVRGTAALTAADGVYDDAPIDPVSDKRPFEKAKEEGAEESGSHIILGMDGTYNLGEITPGIEAMAYLGPRYGMFSASETYKGKTKTASMNTLGVGAGIQAHLSVAGPYSLVADVGMDQYFDNTLKTSGGTFAPGDKKYNELRGRYAFPTGVFKARLGFRMIF